ncbi:retrovirus-related pol polyprotein from transposon TNT 1-94 [Tanacetum coccineum]
MTIIGTKWVYRNKLDENGVVSRNKARLVAQGYNQQEGIDYDEMYALVARRYTDHVYKLKKALYGLKQAPKAWYDRLKAFLIKHKYKMGTVDNTLFTKKKSSNLIIVQIYVDDIIFGSTCQDMYGEFAKLMHDEFEMSMMGELNFFLGLQIKQMEDGIFFNQSKYIKEMLKKFGLEDSKPIKTPMSSDTKLTKDEECESVDSTKYRGMIGSLLYLTTSRPDIMFSVCLSACFQEDPKTSHLEATRSDHGTKRCRSSNPSSSSNVLDHSSSSHHVDENDDGNDEESFHSNTPSPSQLIKSLSNVVPRVFENPPREYQTMHIYQTEILNHQNQYRDEHRKGLRSIGRALKNAMRGSKK